MKRMAKDWTDNSLPVLLGLIKQGTYRFSDADKRFVVGGQDGMEE